MRHAESSETGAGRDHDRPITAAGAATARAVAAQLRSVGWVPQTVICSNALRTRQVR
jgi:phosphohistidine phosphatase